MSTTTVRGEPKYRQLYEEFRDRIISGELRSGDRLPSVAALWEERRVTPTTADKAYSMLEQDALIERRHGSGTYVVEKKPLRTNQVGFVIHGNAGSCIDPYWSHLLKGIQRAAVVAGMRVVLLDCCNLSGNIGECVDGVIYPHVSVDESGLSLGDEVPKICVFAPSLRAPSIVSDDFFGAAALTRHLLGLGHRRIAMLNVESTWIVQRRIDGYREALNTEGLAFDEKLVRPIHGGDYSGHPYRFEVIGRKRMEELFASGWDDLGCTAVMAQNDETAIGVIQACHAAGKRVPQDISVAGFDGTEIGNLVTPALTTVAIPLEEIGEVAVQTLLEILERGKARFTAVSLPTELVIRSSTGPAPV